MRRRGTFEAAQGGTLFLDEIGDISPKLQVDLLRVLEERGRSAASAATSRSRWTCASSPPPTSDLQKAVAAERVFRDDLFYRLNVIPITLPPLRDRREDIPLLVEHFIDRMSADWGASRTASRATPWPC